MISSLSVGWNFVAGSLMRPSSLQRSAVAVKRSGANLGSLACSNYQAPGKGGHNNVWEKKTTV